MKTVFFVLVTLISATVSAQEISRQEADSMLLKLKNAGSDTSRIELLLNLAQYHIFKPGENKIDLDSASIYVDEAKAISKILNTPNANGYLLLTESYLVKEKGQKITLPPYFISAKSRQLIEQAIAILESGTNKDYLGRAYYEFSTYYYYDDSLHWLKKINLLGQSVDAFQQAGDLKRKGWSLQILGDWYGDWYNKWYQPGKSIQLLQEALLTYNSINYQQTQGIYALLGRVYLTQHDYSSSLPNLLKALKVAQSAKDSSIQLAEIYYYIGLVYYNIDRWDMAAKYFNDGLKIAQKLNDESDIFVLTTNLSSVYNNLKVPNLSLDVLNYIPNKNRLSEDPVDKTFLNMAYLRTYIGLKQPDKARPYCNVILSMVDKNLGGNASSFELMTRIYMYAASFYFLSNQYAKARYYMAKSNLLANKINYDLAQVHNLELSYKLDSAEGNLKSAFNNLLLYKQKTDFISSEIKARQFQVMNVEYEVEMKEDSIKSKNRDILLLTQKNSLQQENLNQASLIKNITVVGILLAFIVTGLLYRQYRQKQKSSNIILHKNDLLQHLVEEKDWLVREIHHRVKNNFQTVMGLLGTQSVYLKNEEAINAMNENRQRIQAMSLIHQRLYQSDNLSAIKMTDYVHELVDSLSDSFDIGNRVRFHFAIEPVELDLAHCIPLGLIINEAITNSCKYAFTGNQQGDISISLNKITEDNFLLSIKDSGIGLPPGFDVNQSSSMGMNLMRGLTEELGGRFTISSENGTLIVICFTHAPGHAVNLQNQDSLAI